MFMKPFAFSGLLVLIFLGISCSPLKQAGKHYQKHQDYQSLVKVVELLPPGSDSAYVRKLLGEPIDMGFDFRYLVDSTGERGCTYGAVFHIDSNGKIDQQWFDEICE